MECESVSYRIDKSSDVLATNFDDYIPQLFIKNICKGRLIEPKFRAEYLKADIYNDILPPFTPKSDKPATKVRKERIEDAAQSGDKSYKCNFCTFESYSKYKVRMHRKTHIGEDFACHLCTFKTINKLDLQQHVKGHVNEKIYKCAYCNFQTLYKTGLKTHLLRHTGVKPFKCTYCDYRAFQKIHVERHSATHTSGRSKHECTICSFKTAFKVRLERHLLSHEEHGEGPLPDENYEDEQFLEESDERLPEESYEEEQYQAKQDDDRLPAELLNGESIEESRQDEDNLLEIDAQQQQLTNGLEDQSTDEMKCDLCDYKGSESLLLLHLIETHEGEKL